jgi:hypothetical protein
MRLLAALLAGLAASSAPAQSPPRLFVTALDTRPGIAAETDVELTLPSPTNTVDVYVPPGYRLDLDARPGTVIGTADGSTLVAGAPGIWEATGLSIAARPTSDGGYRLTCSLARPARHVELDIRRGLVNPTAGVVTWRAVAGSVEARSVVGFPQLLTARATLAAGTLRTGGKLTLAGKPRAGVSVHIAVASRDDFADARELGVAPTRADGSYAFRSADLPARGGLTLIAYVNFYVGRGGETIAPPPTVIAAVAGQPSRVTPTISGRVINIHLTGHE